ncbi:MAG: hypothetical protein HY352_00110 [Candidatus Omnitrophica bacterium]|nr:hypothetical protein [Candidatus Omnitrophota bacterium]
MQRLKAARVIVMLLLGGGVACVAAAAERRQGQAIEPSAAVSAGVAAPAHVITTKGAIAEINLTASVPAIAVDAGKGNIVTVTLDPQVAVRWQNGQSATPADLMVGQDVEVDHQAERGMYVAKSIRIIKGSKPAPSAKPMPDARPVESPVAESQDAAPALAPVEEPAASLDTYQTPPEPSLEDAQP